MDVVQMLPERALVRLRAREMVTSQGLHYRREIWDAGDDYEIGVVEKLGEGDWAPVKEGDNVIVKNPLGGKAGTDVSFDFGERKGTMVVIKPEDIVARVE